MNIFKAFVKYIYSEDYKKMNDGSELDVSNSSDQFFSSREKALEYLKIELANFDDDAEVLRCVVEEIPVDDILSETKVHYYDKDLQYLGYFDIDKVQENPQYQATDWVLFLHCDTLLCGLVGSPAEGQEPAYIYYEDNNVKDCSPHDHCAEINIISKISPERAKELLPRKYYEGILRRFREHNL